MKNRLVIGVLAFLFISCTKLTYRNAKSNKEGIVLLAEDMIKKKIDEYDVKTGKEDFFNRKMRKYKIESVKINYSTYTYPLVAAYESIEPQDSIVSFINTGNYFLGSYKRIIYDFSKKNRIYRDTNDFDIYVFKKIEDKLYYSTKKYQ